MRLTENALRRASDDIHTITFTLSGHALRNARETLPAQTPLRPVPACLRSGLLLRFLRSSLHSRLLSLRFERGSLAERSIQTGRRDQCEFLYALWKLPCQPPFVV